MIVFGDMLFTELNVVLLVRIVSTAAMLAAGIYVLLHNPKKLLNRLFFFLTLEVLWFESIFIILPFIKNPDIAFWIVFGNVAVFLMVPLMAHFMFTAIGEERKYAFYILVMYVIATVGIVGSLISPTTFMEGVGPKHIFPWILIPGPLYILMGNALTLGILFPLFRMVLSYVRNPTRNPAGYYILFFLISFPIGYSTTAIILDYPIQFPAVFGSLMGLSLAPLAYGIVADNLLDIRIIAKRALFYSLIIAAIAAVLTLLMFLNNYLVTRIPWVQFWTIPITTAIVAFLIGRLFWLNLVEADRVKYEFFTVAAHKLRTPLTHINWSVRELLDTTKDKEVHQHAKTISQGVNRLIELSDILLESAKTDTDGIAYTKEKIGLVEMTKEEFERLDGMIKTKELRVSIHVDEEIYVMADKRRIQAVLEVYLENAVNYTPKGGFVQVLIYNKRNRIYYSVRDSGIGVSPREQQHIFSKFYRTDAAKRIDTEGIGLGLAMVKNIIRKHGGRVGVESHGENQGSIFWFTLPKKT